MQEVFIPQRLLGLLGDPVGHSLSPLLHNWAMQKFNLPWVYMAWEVQDRNLGTFLSAVQALPIHGLSVTIPHKQSVLPAAKYLTKAAQMTQAVNTLYWAGGELCGDNTDCAGFAAPLHDLLPELRSCLILGSGGAARACITAAQDLGLNQIYVASRNTQKLKSLQEKFAVQILPWEEREHTVVDLLVNTTPLGMLGAKQEETPCSAQALKQYVWVYDLVYNPVQTKLLRMAKAQGCRVISGLDMFICQAQAQFKLWSGLEFDFRQARGLLLPVLS